MKSITTDATTDSVCDKIRQGRSSPSTYKLDAHALSTTLLVYTCSHEKSLSERATPVTLTSARRRDNAIDQNISVTSSAMFVVPGGTAIATTASVGGAIRADRRVAEPTGRAPPPRMSSVSELR